LRAIHGASGGVSRAESSGSQRDLTAADRGPTLHRVTEYADPDLETIAPPPPPSPPLPMVESVPPHRGSAVGMIVALIVVSLVVGFGTATVVLNARDSSPKASVETLPDTSVLGGLIVHQGDAPARARVIALDDGADLTVATLDLCNGSFPSETQRVARRQVFLVDRSNILYLSTEAVLYGTTSGATQGFRELRSVTAHCPSNPVKSPVGEATTTTKFRAAPDGLWPHTPSVDRVAFDLVSTDTSGRAEHSMAIYIRRGRALLGLYFTQPDAPQAAVAGRTTIAGIVALFEARLAQTPAAAISG
jgi:hypothetical protein